jgi:hypothetical protein
MWWGGTGWTSWCMVLACNNVDEQETKERMRKMERKEGKFGKRTKEALDNPAES